MIQKLFFFLLLFQVGLAQTSKKGVKVIYAYSNDYNFTHEVLFFNNDYAVYTMNPENNKWDGKYLPIKDYDSNMPSAYGKVEQVENYLSNHNDTIVMNTVTNDRMRHIVRDTTIDFKWKLYKTDSKLIAGYKCFKAGLRWRGRDYTAYYTPEIPTSFGPYKFKGLPGLILSIQSTSHGERHVWLVTSIENSYEIKSEIALTADELIGKRINLFDLVQYQNNLILQEINIQRSRYGQNKKLVKVEYERNGVEKFFEWEEGKKNRKEYFKDEDFKESNFKN